MTQIVTTSRKTSWLRRAALGVAFATAGLVSMGAVTTPAQAYWYGGYYYPGYYYGPHYGWYGYHRAHWGYGWRGGWGWRHGGYYHHW